MKAPSAPVRAAANAAGDGNAAMAALNAATTVAPALAKAAAMAGRFRFAPMLIAACSATCNDADSAGLIWETAVTKALMKAAGDGNAARAAWKATASWLPAVWSPVTNAWNAVRPEPRPAAMVVASAVDRLASSAWVVCTAVVSPGMKPASAPLRTAAKPAISGNDATRVLNAAARLAPALANAFA